MEKTNLTPSPWLKGQKSSFYSRALLMITLCLFTTMTFAQNKQSQEIDKEANHQAWLEANNKGEPMTEAEKKAFVEQSVEDYQFDKRIRTKMKELGMSEQEISNQIEDLKKKVKNNNVILFSETDPFDNNTCVDATPINCGETVAGNTDQFGFDNSDSDGCGDGNGDKGVWYSITAPGADILTASLCGAAWDTKIQVYSGSCGGLTCVGGNDDSCGLQSEFSWASAAGVTYYIHVTGFQNAAGPFDLTLTGCDAPSTGDSCDEALLAECGNTYTGNTSLSTTVAPINCGGTSSPGVGVWYKIEGNDDDITLDLCNSDYDTNISVYDGSCGALVCVADDEDTDDGCNLFTSTVTFSADMGTTYYVYIAGWLGDTGNYSMQVICDGGGGYEPNENSPNNDICVTAEPLNCGGQNFGDTTFAQAFEQPGFGCGSADAITSPGVWYQFTSTANEYLTLDTCGSSLDTMINVYESTSCSIGDMVCIAGNDDDCGLQSAVDFPTTTGSTYYILVGGWGSNTGAFTLNSTCFNPSVPDNDTCAGAELIGCGDQGTGSTQFATADADAMGLSDCDGLYGSNNGPGVWYQFDDSLANAGDVVVASLGNSNYDTKLTVYTGAACDPSLTCLVTDDDGGPGLTSELFFSYTPGQNYYFYVSGWTLSDGTVGSDSQGDYVLDILCISPPENDLCGDATPLICGDNIVSSTEFSSDDNPEFDCFSGSFTGPQEEGVWHTIIGTGGDIVLDLSGSGFDTKINIFTGICGALTCLTGDDDGGTGLTSRVEFATTLNELYYVYVSGYNGATGDYNLQVDCICLAEAGDCATVYTGNLGEVDLSGTGYSESTTLTAQGLFGLAPYTYVWSDDSGQVNTDINDPSVVVAPIVPTVYTVDITDATGCTSSDTVFVNVIDVTCGSGNSGNDDKVTMCHRQNNGNFFEICVAPDAVLAHLGHGDELGSCDSERDCNNVEPPRDPDDGLTCATGFLLDCGDSATGSTVGAPISDPNALSGFCGTSTGSSGGVWYRLQGNGDTISVSTCSDNTDFDTKINVYTGDDCESDLACIGGNDDDFSCSGNRSTVTFNSDPGREYLIYVHGWLSNEGNYQLDVTCASPLTETVDDGSSALREWHMAPNPTRGTVNMDLSDYEFERVTVDVVTMSGIVLQSNEINEVNEGGKFSFNLQGNVPTGVYFVRVSSDVAAPSAKQLVVIN